MSADEFIAIVNALIDRSKYNGDDRQPGSIRQDENLDLAEAYKNALKVKETLERINE